jgi:hypothetical protein
LSPERAVLFCAHLDWTSLPREGVGTMVGLKFLAFVIYFGALAVVAMVTISRAREPPGDQDQDDGRWSRGGR